MAFGCLDLGQGRSAEKMEYARAGPGADGAAVGRELNPFGPGGTSRESDQFPLALCVPGLEQAIEAATHSQAVTVGKELDRGGGIEKPSELPQHASARDIINADKTSDGTNRQKIAIR